MHANNTSTSSSLSFPANSIACKIPRLVGVEAWTDFQVVVVVVVLRYHEAINGSSMVVASEGFYGTDEANKTPEFYSAMTTEFDVFDDYTANTHCTNTNEVRIDDF